MVLTEGPWDQQGLERPKLRPGITVTSSFYCQSKSVTFKLKVRGRECPPFLAGHGGDGGDAQSHDKGHRYGDMGRPEK
jgi:hypothetical protein